ncbi:hypothetical protein DFP72DRAFT_937530 [Ephemerocybe angulata]|uniref:Uncharacterized protein n=1 Tax=Ephemerocybe angulata TaxID=980116 RepID=A0A8H6LVI6_9AGAR|nr:hypothetical protein DFP72DRAFT_937530 [Tulosesus angulatus]
MHAFRNLPSIHETPRRRPFGRLGLCDPNRWSKFGFYVQQSVRDPVARNNRPHREKRALHRTRRLRRQIDSTAPILVSDPVLSALCGYGPVGQSVQRLTMSRTFRIANKRKSANGEMCCTHLDLDFDADTVFRGGPSDDEPRAEGRGWDGGEHRELHLMVVLNLRHR